MPHTRITAGEWRGRVINTPRGMATRPTRALIRQSLFDILGDRVAGMAVVDLYAGAGTVGFEALSRGAAAVTFVEEAAAAVAAISATAQVFGCERRCRVVRAGVPRWLRGAADEVRGAGLCFIDAPYRDPELDQVLALVGAAPPALVVCEHHRRRRLNERIGALELVRQVRHGLTTLSFLQPVLTETSASR